MVLKTGERPGTVGAGARNLESRYRAGCDLVAEPTAGGAGQQVPPQVLCDLGGGDLLAGAAGEQLGALLVGDGLGGTPRSTSVDPFDVGLASALVPLGPGDPPARRIDDLVGILVGWNRSSLAASLVGR